MSVEPFRPVRKTPYLGVTLTKHGLGHSRLLKRIIEARATFIVLRNATQARTFCPKSRRNFVRNFILSKIDYLLFLQPVTSEVLLPASKLTISYASWILGLKIPTSQMLRASWLAQLHYIATKRSIQTFCALAHFQAAMFHPKTANQTRKQRNLRIQTPYESISSTIRTQPIKIVTATRPDQAASEARCLVKDTAVADRDIGNKGYSRKVPTPTTSLAPLLEA